MKKPLSIFTTLATMCAASVAVRAQTTAYSGRLFANNATYELYIGGVAE